MALPSELPEDYRELQQIAKDVGVSAQGTAEELKARIIAANNPATEAYADDIRKREYEVCGPHPVLGHKPRSKFEAVIPPDQEARLIRRGQIKPVAGDNPHQED